MISGTAQPCANSAALAAHTFALGASAKVRAGQGVPTPTVSLDGVSGLDTAPSQGINLSGHKFQVVGVHAYGITAKMVDLAIPVTPNAMGEKPCNAMRPNMPWRRNPVLRRHLENTVAANDGAVPFPAFTGCPAIHLWPEPLGQRSGLVILLLHRVTSGVMGPDVRASRPRSILPRSETW